MLLKQYSHLWAKDLVIATWFDEDNFMYAWSRDWNTLLFLRKTRLGFHFHFCQRLMQCVWHCATYSVLK